MSVDICGSFGNESQKRLDDRPRIRRVLRTKALAPAKSRENDRFVERFVFRRYAVIRASVEHMRNRLTDAPMTRKNSSGAFHENRAPYDGHQKGDFIDTIALWALILVPIAIALELFQAPEVVRFLTSGLAIIPLARFLGQATEQISARSGAGLGAFLNASFGNAAELIIGLFALRAGLQDLVKASLTGAIIGNALLVLGLAFLAGGVRFEKQVFNRTAAGMNSTLLLLSATGLLVPAVFHLSSQGAAAPEASLSFEISIVLIATYLLSLMFSLKTHRHLYRGEAPSEEAVANWSASASIAVLLASSAAIALMSEFLVRSVEPAAKALGMTDVFVGVIFVAVVGNAAEHSTAVTVALKNKMDISLGIALGSSQQIALFVAPTLVFAGRLFGQPLDLVFTPLEVVAVLLSVLAAGFVSFDGESNWMEGVLLLAVYLILALAFYFLPA